jgi:hypothetical protein
MKKISGRRVLAGDFFACMRDRGQSASSGEGIANRSRQQKIAVTYGEDRLTGGGQKNQ